MGNVAATNLHDYIRSIPDFPKPGILFRDITPLLASPEGFKEAVRAMATSVSHLQIDVLAAAEARGFIFAAPLALELGVGFVPIRKPGKLPSSTHAFEYDLEYGSDSLEIHTDGITTDQNVLVVDDLLATGGTVHACCQLIEAMGANIVGCLFLIELLGLGGAEKIAPRESISLIKYE